MPSKKVETFCQQCHMRCGVVASVDNGRIKSIKNTSCPKGLHAHRVLYHPDRVKHPLKRIAGRGESKWQEVSWGEALGIMADRFGQTRDDYGVEGTATITGCYHKENAVSATFLFSHLIGTPNILDANHLCIIPDVIAQVMTVGEVNHSDPLVDYKHSKCILIWGANPVETRPPQAKDIFKARAEGAKLIVVDPRPTATASRADIWLRVRPGTDACLALGMLNVIINESLYDRRFVEKWCVGFEELKKRVEEYPTSRAAEITWIPEEKIIEAARLFATTKPACLHTRLGSGSQHINATQASRAITILMALVGCIDVEGGNLLGDPLGGFRRLGTISRLFRLPPEVDEKRLGAKDFPMMARAHTASGAKAMLRGEIKAFFVPGSNFVVNEGNSREVWEALKNLDFLVVADLFMTPTAELADLVLPVAHWLETDTPLDPWKDMGPNLFNYVMAAQKVVKPLEECWDDRKIVLELAREMGLKSPWKTVEDFNNWRLEEMGISFDELRNKPQHMISFPVSYRKFEERGFRTASGKIELYSSRLKEAGQDPLPYHLEPPQSLVSTPQLAKEYPLILTTFRDRAYEHTEYRQINPLRKLLADPQIEINPMTASQFGIEDGDEVWIETPNINSRVKGKAKLIPGLHPRVVASLFGWWFPEKPAPEHGCFESNINTIIDNGPPYEPINGNYQARGILCRVGKVSTSVITCKKSLKCRPT
jgi:anaerobic selenocysteine-containing dehydrogenase